MSLHSRIAFRTFLILALLLVLLPIVVASGWFFYRSALSAREEFAQQLADEVSSRVREKIVSFFDVPMRVVTFNVEQARAGQLLYAQPEALMRQFLLQIDQQPQRQPHQAEQALCCEQLNPRLSRDQNPPGCMAVFEKEDRGDADGIDELSD